MAAVPYAHIEAPDVIRIDGVRAYNPGDPIPVDVARRLGLLDGTDAPPVLGRDEADPDFSDTELKVSVETPPVGGTGTTAPSGASTTAPPPQASAAAPTKGRNAPPTP
jgi:hypothetical protein